MNASPFSRLLNYLVLPKEQTEFEVNYLKRMNKIAFLFFCLHIPVIALVAWLHDTGPLFAAVVTAVLLAGPALARYSFQDQRSISQVHAFTAMCMGAALVHFAQGSMQIEMHFYFFVLLALLAVFANPMTILTASATAAVHHLLFYFFLPKSVFNYEASIWVVLVHALFVVLESTAACFVARSFFDDVIGLDKIVQARTKELDSRNQDMRLVLENVKQGFLTLDLEGKMSRERSAIVNAWFGESAESTTFWEYIEDKDGEAAVWFEMGWDTVVEDIMPLELALDQLPKQIKFEETTLRVDYNPIFDAENKLSKILLVISDITEQLAREHAEAQQRELMTVFHKIMEDKSGFLEFYNEANDLVQSVTHPDTGDLAILQREVHTIKGNTGLYGLHTIAGQCHIMESHVIDNNTPPSKNDKAKLKALWEELRTNLSLLLDDTQEHRVELDDEEYAKILQATLNQAPHQEIAAMIQAWKFEPTRIRLHRIASQAKGIAKRLGRGEIDVEIEHNNLRLDPEAWSTFWSSFVHVIRNAVDHGIEPSEERLLSGKPSKGKLTLSTHKDGDNFVIAIQDDGRGICWEKVKEMASQRGIPHETQADLERALFSDGLSTKDEVSEFSGRGVGMAAVLDACESKNGFIRLSTIQGKGTQFRFHFPQGSAVHNPMPAHSA